MDYMYHSTEGGPLFPVKVKVRNDKEYTFNMTPSEIEMLDGTLELYQTGGNADNRPIMFIHYRSDGSDGEKAYIHYDDILIIQLPLIIDVDGE